MKTVLIATFFLLLSLQTHAVEGTDKSKKSSPSTAPEWTSVQRENLATMHENMATCLRSNKSMTDCRAEMKSSCQKMGKEGCPMGGKGPHGMMWTE